MRKLILAGLLISTSLLADEKVEAIKCKHCGYRFDET